MIQFIYSSWNTALIIFPNLLFPLHSLGQPYTIWKQNPLNRIVCFVKRGTETTHWGAVERRGCGGGGEKWHKYLSFNKREKQKQKKHGEEVEQKKLMAVLVLGQQCTLGNYKHKGRNLGLYSAQLSQIIELEEAATTTKKVTERRTQ